MNPYLSIPFLLIVSLLQSTAAPRLQIGAVWPDFLLLVVMSWALAQRLDEAVGWALVGGIGVDLLSGGPFGASAIGLMLVALIAGATSSGLFRGRAMLPIVTAFLATLAFHLVYMLAMLLVGQRVNVLDALLRLALPSAVYNAVLSMIVYWIMAGIDRRIRPKALRW
jgi:rod shape-determining protein MreD